MTQARTQLKDPRTEYAGRLKRRRRALVQCERRYRLLGNLRLGVALAAALVAFLVFGRQTVSGWWLLAAIAPFIWLTAGLLRTESRRDRLSLAAGFYQKGLARLDGRWAGAGEQGERFLNEPSVYAQDLDLFGESSLFELLCIARTKMGETALADWLLRPAALGTVRQRQAAIAELSPRLDLREDFAAIAEDVRTGVHPQDLAAWAERSPVLKRSPFVVVAWALSVAGAAALLAGGSALLAAFGFLELTPQTLIFCQAYFLGALVALAAVYLRFKKRTDRIIHEVEPAARDLGILKGALRRLETERFASPRLADLRKELDVEGEPPSRRIARLSLLMDLLDSRHNQFFAVIAPFLLWDLHLCYALESWRSVSGPALRRWLDAVGEIEALSSLACFHYERPSYVFPEIVEETPLFDGQGLGHPLLPEKDVITNDVRLDRGVRVLIVSGSNMSGKSTLLRTVGVNAVLAQAGAPVFAQCLRLSALTTGASIRVQDSLREGASRFYTEILRLRRIMEKAVDSPPVLFLIDEFLHGTNSHDRRIGAAAIVRGLAERGAIGLITTHDLSLAEIADELGPQAVNVHFEDHLEDGQMRFDYKMRPGVVRKSNAIELMRSVGLEV